MNYFPLRDGRGLIALCLYWLYLLSLNPKKIIRMTFLLSKTHLKAACIKYIFLFF